VLILLLAMALPTSGAASAATETPSNWLGNGSSFRISLPRITIQIDAKGFPSVFGIAIKDLGRFVGQDLSFVRLSPVLVDQLTSAGIQHLELVTHGEGLLLYANAKPIPYLAWDESTLASTGEVLQVFQIPYGGLVAKLLPYLRWIGLDIVIKLPLPQGAQEIPLRDKKEFSLIDPAAALAEKTPYEPSAVLQAEVTIDEQGMPTLNGISFKEIQEETGINLSTMMVPPNLVNMMVAGGIQHTQIQARPDGLFIYMNGKELPHLAWDSAHLANVAELASGLPVDEVFKPILQQVIAGTQAADVKLTIRWPTGGAEVPLHEFWAPAQ